MLFELLFITTPLIFQAIKPLILFYMLYVYVLNMSMCLLYCFLGLANKVTDDKKRRILRKVILCHGSGAYKKIEGTQFQNLVLVPTSIFLRLRVVLNNLAGT